MQDEATFIKQSVKTRENRCEIDKVYSSLTRLTKDVGVEATTSKQNVEHLSSRFNKLNNYLLLGICTLA